VLPQLTVYHYNGGPCYRCLFPKPPPPESVTSCSDGGVLGVVAGIIGCLEALETIKIALQLEKDCVMSGKLLLFDATTTSFRTVKLRPRDKQCAVCGDTPTIKELIDYEGFCNATATDKVVVPKTLPDKFCISTKDYKTKVIDMKIPHILLDVREPVQYAICALPNSINIPLRELEQRMDELKTKRNENSPQSHALPSISIPN
jgi:adenylyltransferase/sulfurtransferase